MLRLNFIKFATQYVFLKEKIDRMKDIGKPFMCEFQNEASRF